MYKRIFKQIIAYILIFVCILASRQTATTTAAVTASSPANSETEQNFKRVCMVLLDHVNLADLRYANAPNIHKLMAEGAIGLVNANTGSTKTPENTFLSLGTGTRSCNTLLGTLALNADEVYDRILGSDIFKSRTGIELPLHSIGVPNLSIIKDSNKNLNYQVEIGMLGHALKTAGYHTAVIGNSDFDTTLRRFGALVAMDHEGIIDYGNVSQQILLKTPSSPAGYVTYYDKMFREAANIWDKANLIILELGDISRLEQYKNVTMEDMFQEHKQKAITEADAFLGRLLDSFDMQNTLLILTSPTPPSSALASGDIFTPCIMWGENITKGMLTSETTRRPGIITNIDIPAAILSYFQLETPPSVLGRNTHVLPMLTTPIKTLEHISLVAVGTYRDRPPMIQIYIGMQIVVLLAATIIILTGKWKNHFLREHLLFYALLSLGLVPLALLLLPLIPVYNLMPKLLYTAIFVLLSTIAVVRFSRHELAPIIWLTLSTTAALLIDIFTGSSLQKTSILGYCPIIGGRFYGIGNEYMGILIGAVIIGSTAVLDQLKINPEKQSAKKTLALTLTILMYAITLFAVGSPSLGANVGGTIVAATAFTYISGKLLSYRKKQKSMFIYGVVGALVLLIVGIFVIIDLARAPEAQTHLAKNIQLITTRGLDVIREIIFRKLATNIKIFRYTIWTRVLLLSLGVLAILFYKPSNYLRTKLLKYPNLNVGLAGSLIASGTALVFNDSGVAPAATTVLFTVIIIVSLVLRRQAQTDK
jgi:hypothetical protein